MKSPILASALICLSIPFTAAVAVEIGFTGTVGSDASVSSGQSTGVNTSVGASDTTQVGNDDGSSSLTTNLSGNASAAGSLGNSNLSVVIGLIETGNWTVDSLSHVTKIEATLYDVSAWITSDDEAAFDAALSANAGEIEDLQAAVSGNLELDAFLAAGNAGASDVIAIGVAADGSLAVFVN